MWELMKLVDAILFIYFLVIVIAIPLLDAQVILPSKFFPDILVHFKIWLTNKFGNYLLSETPHFYAGIAWLEVLFAWPLSIASIYAIVAAKSWLPTTCLIYGVYFLTALVAILSELVGSGKASKKLLIFYYTFLGFAILAILRGLLPYSLKSNATSTRTTLVIKRELERCTKIKAHGSDLLIYMEKCVSLNLCHEPILVYNLVSVYL